MARVGRGPASEPLHKLTESARRFPALTRPVLAVGSQASLAARRVHPRNLVLAATTLRTVFDPSQIAARFFRQVKGRQYVAQSLVGRSDFLSMADVDHCSRRLS